jgi:hypothetical protein
MCWRSGLFCDTLRCMETTTLPKGAGPGRALHGEARSQAGKRPAEHRGRACRPRPRRNPAERSQPDPRGGVWQNEANAAPAGSAKRSHRTDFAERRPPRPRFCRTKPAGPAWGVWQNEADAAPAGFRQNEAKDGDRRGKFAPHPYPLPASGEREKKRRGLDSLSPCGRGEGQGEGLHRDIGNQGPARMRGRALSVAPCPWRGTEPTPNSIQPHPRQRAGACERRSGP